MVALTALPGSPAIDGPRPASPGDVPEVIALVDTAMRDGTDQSMLTDYPLVWAPDNLHNVRVLRVDGELAAVVPVLPRAAVLRGRPMRVGIISPTATAPAHQHRGYGSRCLESAIAAMADAGCALSVLWTLVATFPFYERAGWHPIPYQGLAYALTRADAAAFPVDPTVTVAPLDPTDDEVLRAVCALHDADGRGEGIRRSLREAGALFALPKLRTLVARREGHVAGYLVASRSVNKPGLIEAGGDDGAIETLLREALEALPGHATVDAHALATPTSLGAIIERRMAHRRRVVEASMMVRVNDVDAVLGEPAPADLDPVEWVAALFGSHPARTSASSTFTDGLADALGIGLPLELPIPVLDRS